MSVTSPQEMEPEAPSRMVIIRASRKHLRLNAVAAAGVLFPDKQELGLYSLTFDVTVTDLPIM